MFAPQQFAGMQTPAYCQFLPNPYMTPQIPTMIPNVHQDTREKRNLSPTTLTSPSAINDEKRQRNESGDIDDRIDSGKEPTMLDLKTTMDAIMARLSTTATKVDISTINDKITAQNVEIEQMKVRMQKHDEDLKKLQTIIDEGVAATLHGKLQTADERTRMETTNMAAPGTDRPRTQTTKRRNLIIEGLYGDSEEEMCSAVIKVCDSIGLTIYNSDIEQITRYKRRDETAKKPGPVNVTIARTGLRDTILRKKKDLNLVTEMQGVFINADESLETRKAKSILRKVSRIVKNSGEQIEIRHDRIQLEGRWYTTSDIDQIPKKFMPIDEEDVGAVGDVSSNPNKDQEPEKSQQTTKKIKLIKRGEKMRVTKAGLLFSGPSAYISNMAYAPIQVGDIPHDCNEEAYQYRKCKDHGCDELAEAVRSMEDAHQIKRETRDIVTTEEWNEDAPNKLWELFDIKMRQHPELLERLIATAPLPLIEASTDSRWGGGAPFHSEDYDTGKVTGNNEFGQLATRYRDMKIKQHTNPYMMKGSSRHAELFILYFLYFSFLTYLQLLLYILFLRNGLIS